MNEINFDKEFEGALQAGEEANATEARATAVRFDPQRKEVLISLKFGGTFAFQTYFVPLLRGKSDEELTDVVLSPSGGGLHWERLDVDLSLPSLIEGNYGPEKSDSVSLDRLYAELESVWNGTREAAVVDRLAARYPQYASELYDYFALLIESELVSNEIGIEQSARQTLDWLEAEGFREAHEIAGSLRSTTTATPDPGEGSTPGNSAREMSNPAPNESQPPGEGKVLSFAAYARSKAGLTPHESAERMGVPVPVLLMVENEPPDAQLGIRREIADRSAAADLDPEESYKALCAPQQRAALNKSIGPPKSFRTRLANVGLTPEQLEFWLSLADEESDR
jgi:hypothetical protein